jgi:hypothetical protein
LVKDKDYIDEPYYSSDSEYERAIDRAKKESMLNKKGESSAQAESASQGSKFQSEYQIKRDMLNLKLLEDKALQKAIQHNEFKMQLDRDNVENEVKLARLKPIKEEHDCIKYNINKIKQRLLDKGVNPDLYKEKSTQFTSNSSYTDSEGYSSVEEQKPVKRVKLAGNEDTKTFFMLPFTGSFSWVFSPALNLLFVFISVLFLYLMDFTGLDNLVIPFNLVQIMTLCLLLNSVMLVHKLYNIVIKLYNSYLNKDYFILYTNIYFTGVLFIYYLNIHSSIEIFYC